MRVASVTELDEIITDEGVPKEEIERIRALGVKLTIVRVPCVNEVHILADDLTGALDSAAAFAGDVPVFLDTPETGGGSSFPVSVVATASRDVPIEALPEAPRPFASLAWRCQGRIQESRQPASREHLRRMRLRRALGGISENRVRAGLSAAGAHHDRRPPVGHSARGARRRSTTGRGGPTRCRLLGPGGARQIDRCVNIRAVVGVDSERPDR